MFTSSEALQRLKEGNKRFVKGRSSQDPEQTLQRREAVASGQLPFAVVVGCSDSRVPPELVFDTCLGDLFVIRVAGHVVSPTQLGSIEFAIESFNSPLVVVMGHSCCGAVEATLQALVSGQAPESPHLHAIVDSISPGLESLDLAKGPETAPDLLERAVQLNIRHTVCELTRRSQVIADAAESGRIQITGAQYLLETGVVEFAEQPGEA